MPVPLEVLGTVLLCLGIWLSWEVLKENSYAAPVVKVQKERGHKVVTTGPYAYVRHPMYASVILIGTGVPLLLGPGGDCSQSRPSCWYAPFAR